MAVLGRRGRKAHPAFAVIPGQGRPEPPDGMPEDEAEVWRVTIAGMPPHWFSPPGAQQLLKQYCHHTALAQFTAIETRYLMVAPMTNEKLDTLSKLSAIGRRETEVIASLATRLRMTPQSSKHRFTAEAEVRNTARTRPWEDGDPAA